MSCSNIVNGPSKHDLFLALSEPKFPTPRTVTFQLEGMRGLGFRVVIDSIEAEDGSGQGWNIKGRMNGSQEKFEAYFRTDRRKGTFKKILVH